jgi:hypothetical protein
MNLWEQRFREARLIAFAFLATVPSYAAIGELAGPKKPGDFANFRLVFFVVTVSVALMGFQVRARMIPAALDALRRSANDAAAAQRWTTAHMASLGMAELIAVCGVALRFLGGTLLESLPFYILSMGLMLAFFPRRPD